MTGDGPDADGQLAHLGADAFGPGVRRSSRRWGGMTTDSSPPKSADDAAREGFWSGKGVSRRDGYLSSWP